LYDFGFLIRVILSVGVFIDVKLRKKCNVVQMNCDKNFIHTQAWRDFCKMLFQHQIRWQRTDMAEVRDENIT